jgi:hypothetical protein
MSEMRGSGDGKLDTLFRVYESVCPVPEPSANFMPGLWARIEARQTYTFSFQRLASAFVTAALAVSIALGLYMSIPRSSPASYYSPNYIEALADANSLDTPEIVSPASLDLADAGR